MNNHNEIFKFGSIDDLLFRGKNKNYGAYDLRLTYDERIKKSIILFLFYTASLFSAAILYEKIIGKIDVYTEEYKNPTEFTDMKLDETKKEEPKKAVENDIKKADVSPTTKPIEAGTVQYQNVDIVEKGAIDNLNTTDAVLNSGNNIGNANIEGNPSVQPNSLGTQTGESSGSGETIYEMGVDIMPEFPGGEEKLMEFLEKHTKYPTLEEEMGIEGSVLVRFVVNENGSISKIELESKDRDAFNREAVRVVQSMPKWSPGIQGGHPVKVYFSIPFSFK